MVALKLLHEPDDDCVVAGEAGGGGALVDSVDGVVADAVALCAGHLDGPDVFAVGLPRGGEGCKGLGSFIEAVAEPDVAAKVGEVARSLGIVEDGLEVGGNASTAGTDLVPYLLVFRGEVIAILQGDSRHFRGLLYEEMGATGFVGGHIKAYREAGKMLTYRRYLSYWGLGEGLLWTVLLACWPTTPHRLPMRT